MRVYVYINGRRMSSASTLKEAQQFIDMYLEYKPDAKIEIVTGLGGQYE